MNNVILKKWHLQSKYQSTSMDFIRPDMFIKIYLNDSIFKPANVIVFVDGDKSKVLKNK